MDGISGYEITGGVLNPARQVDELELRGGLDGRDGVIVERVSLNGLELEAIEFPEAT